MWKMKFLLEYQIYEGSTVGLTRLVIAPLDTSREFIPFCHHPCVWHKFIHVLDLAYSVTCTYPSLAVHWPWFTLLTALAVICHVLITGCTCIEVMCACLFSFSRYCFFLLLFNFDFNICFHLSSFYWMGPFFLSFLSFLSLFFGSIFLPSLLPSLLNRLCHLLQSYW